MLSRVAALLVAGASVGALGFENAGYFPSARGWTTVALSLAALLLLVVGRVTIGVYGGALLAAVGAFVVWTAVSLAWSISFPRTVAEIELGCVYLAATAALLAASRSRTGLLLGVVLGSTAVCIAGLVRYASERGIDRFEGTLLFRPVGYANGFGAIAAIGLVLAVGLSAVERNVRIQFALTAATAPLAGALVRTESRGAVLAAMLAFGVAVMVSTQRTATAAAAAPALATAAVAAVVASAGGPGDLWLVVALAAVAVAGAAVAFVRVRLDGRIVLGAAAAAVVGAMAFAAVTGTTWGYRPSYWRAALVSFAHAPVAGTGAGTFALDWLAHRHVLVGASDAHSLELESLAELGPIGLAAVLSMIALPFVAVRRRRDDPLVAVAAAGYTVLVVHSALDWDWEQPAVWIAGLASAVALVAGGGAELGRRGRIGAAIGVAVLAALGALGLRGNILLDDARTSLAAGRPSRALAAADGAARWQPWASEPLLIRARAQLLLANVERARIDVRRAVDADPHDPATWRALAALEPGGAGDAAQAFADRLDPLGSP